MKKHGCLWWVFIGWWWVPITLPFRIPVWVIRWILNPRKKPAAETSPYILQGQKRVRLQEGQETHKVAGVSFRQDALKALGIKNPDFAKTKKQLIKEGLTEQGIYEYIFAPEKVELIPEPDNPYSENGNAVKVVVDGQHIGYIKSGSSAHVSKLLREDQIQQVTCFIGGGRSKTVTALGYVEDENGVIDDLTEYTTESDEVGFYARLTITKKAE